MRQGADWMDQLDERILEHLDDFGWSSPSLMSQHFRFGTTESRVQRRCEVLFDADLIAPIYDGASRFEITTIGRVYLQSEIDANLRRPVPGPRPEYAVRPGWWAGFG